MTRNIRWREPRETPAEPVYGADRKGREIRAQSHVFVRKGRYANRYGKVMGTTSLAMNPQMLLLAFFEGGELFKHHQRDLVPLRYCEVAIE